MDSAPQPPNPVDFQRLSDTLAAAEARYQLLLNSIKDYAIFTLDSSGKVTYWTNAAERIKGYTAAEVIGRPFDIFFTTEERERGEPARELQLARETGRAERVGWRVRKDGTRFWGDEVITALYDANGALTGYSKITRDNTDRRRTEIERERLLRQANEANKVKDEFLSTISHELRTPLNAILGWTQLARMQGYSAELLPQALQVIERNARAQARLIEDLLDVSRIVTGKTQLRLSRIALAEPLVAAMETLRPTAELKNVKMALFHDVRHDEVMGDFERLQQVIWNVLANAIKFTPPEGRITVRTQASEGWIDLSIADTGAGIDRTFLPFVFDRFRQFDTASTREHAGLGLGLSIVKHLIELHGGSVTMESEGLGRGTSVLLRMPLAGEPAQGATAHTGRSTELSPSLRGCRVLIVDDDPDARALLELVLVREGADVRATASVREGVESARASAPQVVLADLSIPGEDGFAFLDKIRQSEIPALRDIAVVAVTANARDEDRDRCAAAGFDAYVRKPVDLGGIIELVARLCAGSKGVRDYHAVDISHRELD